MSLKLQIGKIYLNGFGKIRHITSTRRMAKDGSTLYCATDGSRYLENGKSFDCGNDEANLVSEYVEPSSNTESPDDPFGIKKAISKSIKDSALGVMGGVKFAEPDSKIFKFNVPAYFSYAAERDQKQKRYELAKDFMCGLVSSGRNGNAKELVEAAFIYADEFLKQWNEGEK